MLLLTDAGLARADLASNFRGGGKSAKGDFSVPLEVGPLDCG